MRKKMLKRTFNTKVKQSDSGRWQMLLIILAMMTALLSAAPTEYDPKAAKIMDDFYSAIGYSTTKVKLNNCVMTGHVVPEGTDMKMKIAMYYSLPGNSYTRMDSKITGKIESGTYGDIAWELSTMEGPRLLEGAKRAEALYTVKMALEQDWRKIYKKVQFSGEGTVDGKPCYIVTGTPNGEAPVQTMWIDKKTKLERRFKFTSVDESGKMDISVDIHKYKDVDGVLFPNIMQSKMMGMNLNMILNNILVNTVISDSLFQPPKELKALIEKNK